MPPSHQRHRRSPFRRTSFRRTSSGSSSLRSFFEVPSRSDAHIKSQFSNPKISGRESEIVVIRNADTDKHSVTFHPTVTVTVCQDEMAGMRREDGEIPQLQSQSQILRRENIKGGIEGKDSRPTSSSMYSTNTLGYRNSDPDKDADNGSYTSYSRIERWEAFRRARGFLGGQRAGDGNRGGEGEEEGNESRNGNGNRNGKEKHEKKIRPFLRKYCLHPFSIRSSFRLVGWIEDPVGCRVGHGTAHGMGYAYGGGIGDARLWDEARRSGWEGGLYSGGGQRGWRK